MTPATSATTALVVENGGVEGFEDKGPKRKKNLAAAKMRKPPTRVNATATAACALFIGLGEKTASA